MADVVRWLDDLGLGDYAQAFAENDVDSETLLHLTSDDLREIGVVSVGHRRKLLAAITALGEDDQETSAPSIDGGPDPLTTHSNDAERRQLTVMFCDLVGSTALSEKLDPEDLREVIRAYQQTCSEVVGRFDGHIAKYIGDGLLVYFGYPRAHEDDAQRAVHVGLGIVEGLEELNRRLGQEHGVELAVRLGIHTGLVVAGEMGGGEMVEQGAIVGETPNIAARLQELAKPNTVVLSATTQRLVEGLFVYDGLGPQHLKGISQPVPVYRVRGEGAALSRFEASAEHGLTPLVGREEEIALLLKRWNLAKDAEGQVVLLSGEAGVGKSRILQEFRARLTEEPHHRVSCFGSPYHRNTALYPLVGQLERELNIEKHDGPQQRLDKLEAGLGDLDLPVMEIAPLLAPLLSPSGGERYPLPFLGPEQLKERTLEALLDVIQAGAASQPVLMVFEDAHWLDPSSLEFLSLFIEGLRSARILLAVSFRPEFEPPWGGRAHLTLLTLNNLGRKESTAMVAAVTDSKPLPEEVLSQILTGTDGVPLFVEEMTKTVLESGLLEDMGDHYALSGDLSSLSIPASLQDSLMARLDRLEAEKAVAQFAAALGRTFSFELLAAVSPLEDGELEHALDKLVEAGLIYRHGLPPDANYEFKHALVRDAAYQSLLKNTRQQYHEQIARVLEERFPHTAETEPEVLAYHYTEAGLAEQAVQYWEKAGDRALATYGYEEALEHFQRGLTAKAGQATDAVTASLLFGLGRAQVATLEMDQMSQALSNFRRAFDHFAEIGDISQAVSVAEYPLPMYLVLGQGNGLVDLIGRALALVPEDSKEAGRLLSRYGFSLFSEEGDYEGAQSAFDTSLKIAQREDDKAVEMQTLISAANVEFYQLHWQEGVEKSVRAIELAISADDTRMEVYGRYYATANLTHFGDLERAQEQADALMLSAERLRDRFWRAGAFWMSARVHRLLGEWEISRALLDRGLALSPRDFRLLSDRVVLEFEVGNFSQGEIFLNRLIEIARDTEPGPTVERGVTVLAMGVIGRITGVTDHFDRSDEFAESVISSSSATAILELMARQSLALLAVTRGDVSAAGEQYAALQQYPDSQTIYVTNHRVLGLLAHSLGELDAAATHFEDGLIFWRKNGCRPELAWACCDYADTLLQRDGPGDRAKALSLLDEGLDISRELDMRPLTERILIRKDIPNA